MRLYRVLYHVPGAAPNEPGGVFFIPHQGGGRIDNPADYDVLYAGDSQAGVCAEVFNRGKYRKEWKPEMLRGLPGIPSSRRVLAWYDVDDAAAICDLDDPRQLVARTMRPSHVITRDYARSQAWALRLFEEMRWAGVSWWSYHDARWTSVGLWQRTAITSFGFEDLTIDHPALIEAAGVLSIRVRRPRIRP
jgi:hypothetical protein